MSRAATISLLGRTDAQVKLLFWFIVARNVTSVQKTILISTFGQRDDQTIGNPLDSPGIDFGVGHQDLAWMPSAAASFLQYLPKIEIDLVAFLPPQKEFWRQHLEVVVPHLVVGDHQCLVFQSRVHPEPIVVHSRRCLVKNSLADPGITKAVVFRGEHVPGKMTVVHDQQDLSSQFCKMLDNPIDLFIINVIGGVRKVLFEKPNVGSIDDNLVGLLCFFQKGIELIPFGLASLRRKIRPLLSLFASLELGMGIPLDVSILDNRFVHGHHIDKGSIRQWHLVEFVSLETAIQQNAGASIDGAGSADAPRFGGNNRAHPRRSFRDGIVGTNSF
mmetsp:Transcript_12426/g.25655  ORF Transcript_12426/g.25655 Transcript_12426/m.25655 type:complete len:331 (-) Transcript_12426:435-1427(-)